MMMQSPAIGSLTWFARHELNLSWRDFVRMMSAGQPGREKSVIGFMVLATLVLHTIAYLMLHPDSSAIHRDKQLLITLTGCMLLTFSLMMSQAMELVTRVFYSRSDLDLILSSPASQKRVFAVRMGAIAAATTLLSALMFGPAINVMVLFNDVRWLAAYPVVLALGTVATALSLALTILMFKTLGARKTRLVSQIVAAIVGAGFIIGIQIFAIASFNSISGISVFQSDTINQISPDFASLLWLPARAAMGDGACLLAVMALSAGLLYFMITAFAGRFGPLVIAASGINQGKPIVQQNKKCFEQKSCQAVLREKEWKLLFRDHWLISQTLMQILYLLPPAFMLWKGLGSTDSLAVVALPVLVMASGQLAGGLAWLAISGEDAPQLVQTAPISNIAIIRAKIEAVLGAIGFMVLPILLFIGFMDVRLMIIAGLGIGLASGSATMIQLWFRSQAKRASFRRRQTSSKVATLSEAFSSIMWAGATGLAASNCWVPAIFATLFALMLLWIARSFRPQRDF